MDKIKEKLLELQQELVDLKQQLNFDAKPQQILELEALTLKPDFWADDQVARKITQELSDLKAEIDQITALENRLTDALAMLDHALEVDLTTEADEMSVKFESLKIGTYLSGPYDK